MLSSAIEDVGLEAGLYDEEENITQEANAAPRLPSRRPQMNILNDAIPRVIDNLAEVARKNFENFLER